MCFVPPQRINGLLNIYQDSTIERIAARNAKPKNWPIKDFDRISYLSKSKFGRVLYFARNKNCHLIVGIEVL
jgi:hypothetical protein